jgi:hypothetical protein
MKPLYEIRRSALFIRQVRSFARSYAQDVNAGTAIALRFVDMVEEATRFIQGNPFACAVYVDAKNHPKLSGLEYRKWNVKGFPHSVFFKVDGEVITIAALYAQRMNIAVRFPSDIQN